MWFELKQKLDSKDPHPPYFNEGEVWWCSVGANIGTEVNGKSELFTRPVIILRKLSIDSFIGIPMTSKIKVGSWYVSITLNGSSSTANLAQIKTFSYRRLSTKYGQLDMDSFLYIKAGLKELLNL